MSTSLSAKTTSARELQQSQTVASPIRYNRVSHKYSRMRQTTEQWRSFQNELAEPLLCQEPYTDSLYKIYRFNQDRYDPKEPIIGLFHAFGSSPKTRQGYEICWELRQRFPNSLIIAIGSEGTSDVTVSRRWLNLASHETLALIRRYCLDQAREWHQVPGSTPLNLVGQSYGGIMAYEITRPRQGYHDETIQRIALLATPSNPMRTRRFVTDLTRQEFRVVVRRSARNELVGMSKNAAEISPRNLHTGSTQKKLLSLIASSRVDVELLDPKTDITICAGEYDAISRYDQSETSVHGSNLRHVIVEGDVHSDFLSDTAFCGHLIETAWS